MGNYNKIQKHFCYSVEAEGYQKINGQTIPRKNPKLKNNQLFFDCPEKGLETMQKIWEHTVKKFGNNNCFGWIEQKTESIQGENKQIEYKLNYMTYNEVNQYVKLVGKSLDQQNLNKQNWKGQTFRFVGIFSKNCKEWMFVDFACIYYQFVSVPLYDTLGIESINHILYQTKMEIIFGTNQNLSSLQKCRCDSLKTLVFFDEFDYETKKFFENLKIKVVSFEIFLNEAKHLKQKQASLIDPSKTLTLCYTSGTTGLPKGAMLTHRNFSSENGVFKFLQDIEFNQKDIHISYLPLPHVFERVIMYATIYNGGCAWGDVQKIKQDLQIIRPTFFCSVPRLYNKFYNVIKQRFSEESCIKKFIINKCIQSKKYSLENSSYQNFWADLFLFGKTKAALGGRCKFCITGSAPINSEVIQFLKMAFCCPILQGFGQTESLGGSTLSRASDMQTGHVGGPLGNVIMKLVDIPEIQYLTTDVNEDGKPLPRGEVCFYGPGVFKGYYIDDEKTLECIDKDGWLHTGDVGEIRINGSLKIIDRKKNLFKLQQGEYVSPENIQNFILKLGDILEVFLHGQSLQSYAIAILVPNQKQIIKFAQQHSINGNFDQLLNNLQLRKEYTKHINNLGKNEGIKSFQLPKNIRFEKKTFSENQCTTTTFKLKRHTTVKFFKQKINQMYKEGQLI